VALVTALHDSVTCALPAAAATPVGAGSDGVPDAWLESALLPAVLPADTT
jgi:hypothetical protein